MTVRTAAVWFPEFRAPARILPTMSRTSTPPSDWNTMRTSTLFPVSALLVAGLILTGCTSNSVPQSLPALTAQTDTAQISDTQVVAIEEAFKGLSYDYDPFDSTTALAKVSTVVVSGTVKRIQDGRIAGRPTDVISNIHTIVIVIETSKIAHGKADAKGNGLVYVEVPSPGSRPASEYAEAIPVGTAIVAYLMQAPSGADEISPFQNPASGRPTGVTLYMPTNPQSLLIELQAGGVSLLLEHDAHEGKLADALPGGVLILGKKK
jgi:hypothetical protein